MYKEKSKKEVNYVNDLKKLEKEALTKKLAELEASKEMKSEVILSQKIKRDGIPNQIFANN